ncbi:transmembrane protein, putative (macronuclear) [Tetrahymena thermophila SB210]|uniref:Transmembrane protein, putative n=1 Tax=Tetrahymena thermophila (strain SB210) TaxID=312017 RepID=Q245U1_TETTS|nr:transmembrane protein, putative [Tetrahymena thermophila SB210]EAS03542.2 transmembrane protein, putative [Tetrahymena thermophila SB210]|eukprot:XP_001023787.2 transmembrane protein, putative [Tetrahymena thermophila SB210]
MVNYFRRILTKLDIFGSNVGLNYNKNNMFQTSIGGVLSIFFCALVSIFFWNNIIEFLRKTQVTSSTTQQYSPNPDPIVVNAQNFMFAVKIQQDNFVKNPVLNITLETRDYQNYDNGTTIKLKYKQYLEPCTQQHFAQLPSYGTNWTEVFIKYQFNDYLCPLLNYNFTVGGDYNSPHFFHWKFSVGKCFNSTNPNATWQPTCQSTDAINNLFATDQNVRFLLYTSNYIINPKNSEGYVSSFVEDSLIFSVQKEVAYTTADIFFTQNTINTDQSLIPFKDIQTEQYLRYSFGNLRQQYVIGYQPVVYGDFYIRKDCMSYIHNRSFTKISEILSYIGGFTQVFILFTAIIVNYYNDYMYSISLANKLYDFEFSNQNDSKSKDKKSNPKPLTSISKKDEILNRYKQNKLDKIVEENDNVIVSKQELPIIQKQEKNQKIVEQQKVNNNQIQIDMLKLEDTQKVNHDGLKEQNNRKSKKKKVTTREDDGLISLDKLKFILNERQQNQSKNQEKNQLLSKGNEIQNINSEIDIKSQYTNQFYENMKRDSQQVEQKDVMNESITPESPLKKIKQNKKQHQQTELIQKASNKAAEENEQKSEFSQGIDSQRNQNYLMNQELTELTEQRSKQNSIMPQGNKDLNSPSQTPRQNQEQKKLLENLGIRDKKHFLTKEFEYLVKRQKSITMTFKFFLYKISFGRFFRTEQVLLLDKAEKQMKKDLDVFMILNRIKELEKFKALFLDRNQEILFNFFPKPIISITSMSNMPSRAEMTDLFNQISKQEAKKKNMTNTMKKLKLKFKTALLVTRAVQILKRPLHKKVTQFDTISAYRKLFDAYESLRSSNQNISFNTKLITLLGEEMNKILEIANLIEVKNDKRIKESSFNKLNQEIPNSPKLGQSQLSSFFHKNETYRANNSFQLKPEEYINSGENLFSRQNYNSELQSVEKINFKKNSSQN